jgi:hypothetical protein
MSEITNEILAENSINQSMLYTDENDNNVVYVFKNDEYITATTAEELSEALSGGGVAIAENLFTNESYGGTGTTSGTDMDEGDASPTDDLSSFFTKLNETISSIGRQDREDEPTFVPTPKQIEDIVPWLAGKGGLLQSYVDSYIETGNAEFALGAVRNTEEYALYYPGIKRVDGSLRMNEAQYEQVREGYYRILLENDLNPLVFEEAGKVSSLIAGDVSVSEFRTRIESARTAFTDNPIAQEIKDYYSANFQIDLTDNAVFAASLDPDISISILQNQISQSQLGAEAALRNLDLTTEQAQRLIQAGITQSGGQRLFARASDYIQQLNRLRMVQGRPNEINLQDIINTEVQQDPAAQREQERILNQNKAISTAQAGAAQTQGGEVAGLTEA